MEPRLGELLVDSGAISASQLRQLLERQQRTGEPIGLLAERVLGVDPAAVEAAWARQYAGLTRMIDPAIEAYDDRALALVTRRQAWQFRVLPVRFEQSDLMLATTQLHLGRALRFANRVLGMPVYLVLAEPGALGEALDRRYPMPGLSAESVLHDPMRHLVRRCLDEAG
jgi:hypothetical protein